MSEYHPAGPSLSPGGEILISSTSGQVREGVAVLANALMALGLSRHAPKESIHISACWRPKPGYNKLGRYLALAGKPWKTKAKTQDCRTQSQHCTVLGEKLALYDCCVYGVPLDITTRLLPLVLPAMAVM